MKIFGLQIGGARKERRELIDTYAEELATQRKAREKERRLVTEELTRTLQGVLDRGDSLRASARMK